LVNVGGGRRNGGVIGALRRLLSSRGERQSGSAADAGAGAGAGAAGAAERRRDEAPRKLDDAKQRLKATIPPPGEE